MGGNSSNSCADWCGNCVDSWESFTSERDAILAALPTDRTVIVLSGDRHYFAQHAHASGLREFVCGPLAAGLNTPPVPLPSGVIASAVTRNFLDVHIRGGALPTLTVDARDADGVSVFTEVFTA